MAHSVKEAYLDNEAINKYLEVLSGYIKEAGIGEHRILVVGGAAMALNRINFLMMLFFIKYTRMC